MATIDKYIENRDKLQFVSAMSLFKLHKNFSATVGPVSAGSMDEEVLFYDTLTAPVFSFVWFRAPSISNVWGPPSIINEIHYLAQGIYPGFAEITTAVETFGNAVRLTVDNSTSSSVSVEFKGVLFYA